MRSPTPRHFGERAADLLQSAASTMSHSYSCHYSYYSELLLHFAAQALVSYYSGSFGFAAFYDAAQNRIGMLHAGTMFMHS